MANSQKHRIFVAQKLSTGLEVVLDPEQTHYIRRVLRLRDLDTLLCFDGSGTSYIARIRDSKNKNLRLLLDSEYEFQAKSPARIYLFLALIKKPEKVLQKATELGVTDIWPINSQRSEVRLSPERLDQKLQHWSAVLTSACEQSGRNRIPRLHSVGTFAEIVRNPPCKRVYLFQPGAPLFQPATTPRDTCLLIGPEGGWTDEELKLATHAGFVTAGFGKNVLRADTAPMVALAILQHTWSWQFA